MSRRSALPGAAELFRSTGGPSERTAPGGPSDPAPAEPQPSPTPTAPSRAERLLAEPQDQAAADLAAPAGPAEAATPGDSAGTGPAGRSGSGKGRVAVASEGSRVPTGRERHDEKITVYVSVAELLDIERARLTLRGEHGLAVDRGRIVREALAVVLADLEAEGEASTLVRRLRSR